MKTIRAATTGAAFVAAVILAAAESSATLPTCEPDMTNPGSFCIDRYEASVWSIPLGHASLIEKVRHGTATLADLTAGGAVQRGVADSDYGACNEKGGGCKTLFALSIAGVSPSANITWFQAQQACANSKKRLPRNAEWQQAASGTPDPDTDTDKSCAVNRTYPGPAGYASCTIQRIGVRPGNVETGSRSSCRSRFGNYDMVGNVKEWVEDWVPGSTGCPGWETLFGGAFSDDEMCLSGASTTQKSPGALVRGGDYCYYGKPGPLSVEVLSPTYNGVIPVPGGPYYYNNLGFRCAR